MSANMLSHLRGGFVAVVVALLLAEPCIRFVPDSGPARGQHVIAVEEPTLLPAVAAGKTEPASPGHSHLQVIGSSALQDLTDRFGETGRINSGIAPSLQSHLVYTQTASSRL